MQHYLSLETCQPRDTDLAHADQTVPPPVLRITYAEVPTSTPLKPNASKHYTGTPAREQRGK